MTSRYSKSAQRRKLLENAYGQIAHKQELPQIDFSVYTTEDGQRVSTRERVIKDVQAPAFQKPTPEQFWSQRDPSKPDVQFLKNHFYREGRLSEEHALYILEKGTEILRAEPNLLYVDAPVTGTCRQYISSPPGVVLTSTLRDYSMR